MLTVAAVKAARPGARRGQFGTHRVWSSDAERPLLSQWSGFSTSLCFTRVP